MRRWLFNILAAVSLVLCVATTALWVRSYVVEDDVARAWPYQTDRFTSRAGRVYYERTVYVAREYRDPKMAKIYPPQWYRNANPLSYTNFIGPHFLGFAYTKLPVPGVGMTTGGSDWFLSIPHGFLVMLFVALPLRGVVIGRRNRHRRRQHLCAACGYDLRASPDRCPECGLEVVRSGT